MLRTPWLPFVLLLSLPVLAQEAPPLPRDRPAALGEPDTETEAPASAPTQAIPAPVDPAQPAPAAESPEAEAPESLPLETAAPAEPAAPPRPYQTQCPALVAGQLEASLLPPISDGDCGAQSPLAVTGVLVNGRMVPLSGEATMTCEVATTLPQWGQALDGFLQARENTQLATLNVGTSFACRDRVGGDSDRISEHGMADALDIVGFSLEDGRTISVEADWPKADAPEGKFLRFAHDAACSSFSTTLGPEANAEHHDHFHLDMGCHGAACTARLCE